MDVRQISFLCFLGVLALAGQATKLRQASPLYLLSAVRILRLRSVKPHDKRMSLPTTGKPHMKNKNQMATSIGEFVVPPLKLKVSQFAS